jgi:hypothetical protein
MADSTVSIFDSPAQVEAVVRKLHAAAPTFLFCLESSADEELCDLSRARMLRQGICT